MEGLKTLAQRWNIPSLNSSLIPGLPLYKFYARDTRGRVSRTFKLYLVGWGIRENPTDHWGIGILPIVEVLGAIEDRNWPTRNDLEKERSSTNCLQTTSVQMFAGSSPASGSSKSPKSL